MARKTAVGNHRLMLENERARFIGVALQAYGVAGRPCAQLFTFAAWFESSVSETAMGIMTIGALDQAFIHPVVKRHVEERLDFLMAVVAKLRLRFDEQCPHVGGVVRIMTINTRNSVAIMHRSEELHILMLRLMAEHAALANLLRGHFAEVVRRRRLAARSDMYRSGTMTPFATLLGSLLVE